jgi:hypothetical protein
MKEQQRVDPELAWVVRWRETGEEPTEGELFLGDSRSKYYWRRDPDLRHPRSHFFFLLILTLSHGLTPRSICQGDHVIYILVKTGPDHNSLTWLMNFKEPQGQLARWLEELSQFNMEIQHRPGKKHANADALSRIPGGNHVQTSI